MIEVETKRRVKSAGISQVTIAHTRKQRNTRERRGLDQ